LQTGSYNYSAHTQASNWENVVLIDDQKLIDLYQKDFAWMKSLARAFSEDLAPEDPTIQTPIPRADSLDQSFNGVPIPIASFSPAGGTDDAWIQPKSGS
jgi:phosphatidylserine/phosphatidylglycerophosphate/cardiolipin synthase-like enzyme